MAQFVNLEGELKDTLHGENEGLFYCKAPCICRMLY